MAVNVNFRNNNEKKDKHFKRFIQFFLATLVCGGIGIATVDGDGPGPLFIFIAAITGILTVYNFIMYRYNR